MDKLETEARLFTHYLIRRAADSQVIQLYKSAMQDSRPKTTDKKLLAFMVSHPKSIGLIDAGLVFHNASSEARRRLYVMSAILEASPKHHDLHIAKQRRPIYILVAGLTGIRALIKAGLGILLVKAIV